MNEVKLDLDIYNIWYTPFWKTKFFFVFLTAIFLLKLFIFFYFFKRRKISNKFDFKDLANEFDSLNAIIDSGDSQNFYYNLTNRLKKFISWNYNINIDHVTEEELLYYLNKFEINEIALNNLSLILQNSSKAKFAKYEHNKIQMAKDLQDSIYLINVLNNSEMSKLENKTT